MSLLENAVLHEKQIIYQLVIDNAYFDKSFLKLINWEEVFELCDH